MQASEQNFRIMFEKAAIGIAFVGITGEWLHVNAKVCAITGYGCEELQGKTFQDITYAEDIVSELVYIERLLADEIPDYTVEKRCFHKNGSLIWLHATVSLVRDNAGMPHYFIVFLEDITQRKRAEVEQYSAREATARTHELGAILEAMADAVLVYDREGNITFASASAHELFPLDSWPDHLSQSMRERSLHYQMRGEDGVELEPEQAPPQRLLRGEVLKGAHVVDIMIHAHHGRQLQISISGSPVRDAQGEIVGAVLIARDVTKRRNLERRTQRALEGLLELAELLVQLPEDIEEVDVSARELVELTCSVLGCQRVGIWSVEPGTGALCPLAVSGMPEEQEREWWVQQERFVASMRNAFPVEYAERLHRNEVLVLDMRKPPFNTLPNPYAIHVMLMAPMYIGDRLMGFLALDHGAVAHTYTQEEIALAGAIAKLSALVLERQRLLSERADVQGRVVALREANKRMEEFLGIASHELRTPLTTIKANVQLAMRRLRGLSQQPEASSAEVMDRIGVTFEMLQRAERQVNVLNRLVNDLIDISRIQAGKLQLHLRQEPANLVSIVTDAVHEQRKVTPARTIRLCLPVEEYLPVIADPDRIVQVLTNYVSNALKYSAADKPVEVWLELEGDGEGRFARVSVRDQGPGLVLEEQQRVWECFYQSQSIKVQSGSGVGLGLGLHISQTLIERHHGQVGVISAPGEGSTFWFTLPLAGRVETENTTM